MSDGTRVLWQHAKTRGVYEVICHAREEATGRPVVVYKPAHYPPSGQFWTRPLEEFYGPNEDGVPRFHPYLPETGRPFNSPSQVPG